MLSLFHVQMARKFPLHCSSPLISLDADMLQDCSQDRPHSLTTLNPPLPPGFPSLFLKMPLTCGVPTPPDCLLASLNLPLSISCLPASVTRWCPAIVSAGALKRLSTALLRVPRRVSPAPCHESYQHPGSGRVVMKSAHVSPQPQSSDPATSPGAGLQSLSRPRLLCARYWQQAVRDSGKRSCVAPHGLGWVV